MTREEAINTLGNFKRYISGGGVTDRKANEALDMAIEALQVEPVINKIRAEIEEEVLESLSDGGDDWFTAEKVNECLDIIDKYKTESEDKE